MHVVLKGQQLVVEEVNSDIVNDHIVDNVESTNNINETSDQNQIREKN